MPCFTCNKMLDFGNTVTVANTRFNTNIVTDCYRLLTATTSNILPSATIFYC